MAVTSPIVVLRALGLGDLLCAVPAFRALDQHYGSDRLILAAPTPMRPILELAGLPWMFLPTPQLTQPLHALARPAAAINLHGRGPQSHQLLAATRPEALVAYGCADADHPGPSWREEEHERHRWCRLLAEELDLQARPSDYELSRSELRTSPRLAAGEPAILIHPGAAAPARRWPAQRYSHLARLLAHDHPIVVTGTEAEWELCEQIRLSAGLPPQSNHAGRTNLMELAALVAQARLVISGDTGIAHLAAAYHRPTVTLFGPVSPTRWGPPPRPQHQVLYSPQPDDPPGDPHGGQLDPALARVSVTEVFQAAVTALEP